MNNPLGGDLKTGGGFPFRSAGIIGAARVPMTFGNVVANAVDLFKNIDTTFPDWNLDGDRGLAWSPGSLRAGYTTPMRSRSRRSRRNGDAAMALRRDRTGSPAARRGHSKTDRASSRRDGSDRGRPDRDRPDRETPGEDTRLLPDEREGRVPRGRNRDNDRTWTPWILIRYKELDHGARSIPDGEVFWASPGIWVETPDPSGNPIAGRPTFVHAQIVNLGKAPAYPVCVDFYWGDPSPSFGPGNMNHIGTEWVEVDTHGVADVRCSVPWTPIRVNDGHECLMVNSASPIHDWNKSVARYPFQPKHDRRVGQRNVTVLPADAGATLGFEIGINNLFPMTAMATVMAHTAHVAVDRQAAGDTLSAGHRQPCGRVRRDGAPRSARLGRHRRTAAGAEHPGSAGVSMSDHVSFRSRRPGRTSPISWRRVGRRAGRPRPGPRQPLHEGLRAAAHAPRARCAG